MLYTRAEKTERMKAVWTITGSGDPTQHRFENVRSLFVDALLGPRERVENTRPMPSRLGRG